VYQQPQEVLAHCSNELFEDLLHAEIQEYCSAVNILMYPWSYVGRLVSSSWGTAPCWQQYSSAKDIRHVLLVLLPLLQAWEGRNEFDSTAPAAERARAAAEDRGLDGSLQLLCHLPVLLLQLAIGACQRSEAALCTVALRTAVAAARCLYQEQQRYDEHYSATTRVLLLQWLQLEKLVLHSHSTDGASSSSSSSSASSAYADSSSSSSASSAAADDADAAEDPAAAAESEAAEMRFLLLEVLAAVTNLGYDWYAELVDSEGYAPGPVLATQIAAALERIVRVQVPETAESAATAASQAALRAAAAANLHQQATLGMACAIAAAPQPEPRSGLSAADVNRLAAVLTDLGYGEHPSLGVGLTGIGGFLEAVKGCESNGDAGRPLYGRAAAAGLTQLVQQCCEAL
jgi:hypothetical protein